MKTQRMILISMTAIAVLTGGSGKSLKHILCDKSPSRLPGRSNSNPRNFHERGNGQGWRQQGVRVTQHR